jgi:hypothetical protein
MHKMKKFLIKLFEEYSSIDDICAKYGIKNYTINPDGTVDVDGDVYLRRRNLKELPLKFGKVGGYFNCYDNKLTTLEGVPKEVSGGFYCSHNQLTTLEGAPKEVGGNFNCSYNQLTTLEGSPKEVGGDFYCNNNQLTTLEGAPKEVGGNFYCDDNKLTTLEGSPKVVSGDFGCRNNPLPEEILNFHDKKYILKWQDDYVIWQYGKLNLYRFQEMIKDYDLG